MKAGLSTSCRSSVTEVMVKASMPAGRQFCDGAAQRPAIEVQPRRTVRPALRRISFRAAAVLFFVAAACLRFEAARATPTATHLVFDAADYVEIAGSDDLDMAGGEFTLSAWIRADGWGDNNQGRIIDHGGGSSGNLGWTLQLENKPSNGYPRALRMQINNSSQSLMSAPGIIDLATWHHVAVTFDSGTLQFYLDGAPQGTRTAVPVPLARNAPVRIGGRATDDRRGFDGAIDEVRIWNRALSQQEIVAGMNAELTGGEAGLLAYLPMNENSGQFATDLTANAHDGRLGATAAPDALDPDWVSSAPPPNAAPVVEAGDDQAIALPVDTVQLNAVVTDDGQPAGEVNLGWSRLSGPGEVSFLDSTAASTAASFVTTGDYVLQLTASDTLLESSDQLSVTVYPSAVLTSVQVTPDPAVLVTGAGQQFQAQGLDQTGQPYTIVPGWAATGGTIDANGYYTAGAVPGEFLVTASAEGVNGEADIIVADSLGPWPTDGWAVATPADMGMDQALLEQARDYALTGGGAGMITRLGHSVLSWGNTTNTFDVLSVTKSIGGLILGLAIGGGLVTLNDRARTHYPAVGATPASNTGTGWLDDLTILQLATQTGGFDKPAGYIDILYPPGTTWAYSDGGVNWLADTLTVVYQRDLSPLLAERIAAPLGIPAEQLTWSVSSHRDPLVEGFTRRELSASIRISADAMARLGYLMLRNGAWDGQIIIPPAFVATARTTVPGITGLPVSNDTESRFAGAPDHYGILWWNNADGALPSVPTDAFWAFGKREQFIIVIPSLDIVASRNGGTWSGSQTPSYYQRLAPFIEPIVQSVAVFGNEPPLVDAGGDDSITLPTSAISLDGTVSDDGQPSGTLVVEWSLVSGPAAVTFADTDDTDTTATFSTPGTYTLRLSATDGLSSAYDEVVITVLPEPDTEPPVVTITEPGNGTVVYGVVSILATATDNDTVEAVEFFAAGASLGIDTDPPYSTSWNTTTESDGPLDVTAMARDRAGNEGGDTISVTVDNAGTPNGRPVADAGADLEITWPADTVTLAGTATDDGLPAATLTTNWTAVDPPAPVSFADASALDTAVTFGGPGIFLLRLAADDGELQATDDLSVTVHPEPAGEQIFPTTGDSFINGQRSGSNYGGSARVVVHNYGPKIGLVQFDLAAIAGSTVTSATLNFRLHGLRNGGLVSLHVVEAPWSEFTVTWDNQPAHGAVIAGIALSELDVGSIVSVDVTALVRDWASGAKANYGLRLTTGQNIKAEIDSAESGGIPMTLAVTTGGGLPAAETPAFSPAGGDFSGSVDVMITSETDGATIYYTFDGSAPDTGSAEYLAPVTLTQTTTLRARAYAGGHAPSAVGEAIFTKQADGNQPPVLAPIGPKSIVVGETLEFTVTATDADGTTPALTAENLPGNTTPAGFSTSGGSGAFSWTPVAGDAGTYPAVTFIAADEDDPLLTDSEIITISVENPPGSETTLTLDALEDSYVNGNASGRNYGSSPKIVVHNYGPKIGLVRFDTAPVNGAAVTAATLNFRLNGLKNAGEMSLHLATGDWNENSVDYDSLPAFGPAVRTIPLGRGQSEYAVDVTDIVQDWADGTQFDYGLALTTGQNIKAEIESIESGGVPMELVVMLGE